MINITLVQDFDSFFSLKQEWTALIEESEYVGATLTWEWVQVWLKYFQKEGELWILLRITSYNVCYTKLLRP